jgi:hypothetical protein
MHAVCIASVTCSLLQHLLAGASSMWLPVEFVLASVDDHVVAAEGVEGASRRPPAAQQRQHHRCTVTMIEFNTRPYNTCLGWNPAPALASEPIVRSWGVRNCTQLQFTVIYATAALCDVHNV